MPAPFKRLSVPEFALLLDRFPFSRRVTSVHMHHTWRPNHAQFRGHDSIVAMWRFHVNERGFSDIAQHITIDPEGFVWTGRNWNARPASANGFNGNAARGPFMFEIIGDFDRGMDKLEGAQLDTVLSVISLVQAKFALDPEALMFHNQMATKSCPGTAVDRADVVKRVKERRPAAGGQQRDAGSGPFGREGVVSQDVVEHAITLLTEGGERAVEAANAELEYDDEACSAVMREAETPRADEPALGPDVIEQLRPHVVNLRMGGFSTDGKMTSTANDVDALFDDHLQRWVDAQADAGAPARVVFFAHGGLVKESSGLAIAHRARAWWLRNEVYPINFIWETGLFETLGDLLGKIRRRAVPEGARDIFDWTSDPLVEEAARALQAPRIWGGMKASAAAASAMHGGARYVALRLKEFMERNQGKVELHAVGHSAGSIFHGHFLPVCRDEGVEFRSLQLLAPAITCEDFKRYLGRMRKNGGSAPHTTLYTMNRTFERDDHCARVYRKSLLYLVHEACERERKTPILGLEDSLRSDAELRDYFGLRTPASTGTVVWSKSPADTGRSATRSTSHGGFDDDAPTMGSVLRRIRNLQDADPIDPFPSSGARALMIDWSEQVDWPAPFDRKWTIDVVPPQAANLPTAPPTEPFAAPATGRRIAVCVGINAYDSAPLSGCVADAKRWKGTLEGLGFSTRLVTDKDATRKRMLDELRELITTSRAGDSLVFQYSGHGTQVDDLNGDEAVGDTPGRDEAMCPVDYEAGRFLIDDDIAVEVAKLPADVKLSFLLDCCHSGTGTRLAARASDDAPPGANPRRRYIVPTEAMQEAHKRFREQEGSTRAVAQAVATMREVTFAACRSREVAWEVDGQGEFTRRAHEVLAKGVEDLTNVAFLEAVLRAFGSNARQQPQLDCDVALRTGRWLGL